MTVYMHMSLMINKFMVKSYDKNTLLKICDEVGKIPRANLLEIQKNVSSKLKRIPSISTYHTWAKYIRRSLVNFLLYPWSSHTNVEEMLETLLK